MKTVAILCGGVSPEHEVSVRSAKNILNAIDKSKWQVEVIGIAQTGTWRHLSQSEFMSLDHIGGIEGQLLTLVPGTDQLIRYDAGGQAFPTIDVVFPIVHGPFGEDGTLQGLLQVLGLPFVGPDALGSAVGMDKDFTKRILRDAGIPNAAWVTLWKHLDPDYATIVEDFGFLLLESPT